MTAIVDENRLPQFGWPDTGGFIRVRLYDGPAAKFAAFGWHVVACDGHYHDAIRTAFNAAVAHVAAPTCVVARIVKGQGISFMEGDFNWHAKVPFGDDLTMALAAIDRRLTGEDERPAR